MDRENDIEELTTKKINSAAQEEPSPRRLTREHVIYQGRILPSSLEEDTSKYPFLASRTECTSLEQDTSKSPSLASRTECTSLEEDTSKSPSLASRTECTSLEEDTSKYPFLASRTECTSLEEDTSKYPFLASRTEGTLKQRCAQELFFHFILSVGTFMYENQVRVGGNTTLAPPNTMDAEASFKEELMSSKFHNSILDKIAVEI